MDLNDTTLDLKIEKDCLFNTSDWPKLFEFNEAVDRVFDDMVSRSVPLYREVNESVLFWTHSYYSRYVNLGRDTRDLEFLLQRIRGEKDAITQTFNEIAALNPGDGFVFILKHVKDLAHEHMKYPGFTASFLVTFGKMKEALDVDIGIGDVVDAQFESLKLMTGKGNSLFKDDVSLLVYPPETILAEKLQTLILRAEQNSRMKDYYDILTILRAEKCEGDKAKKAILATFKHRDTDLSLLPIRFSDDDLNLLQKHWSAFFRSLRKKDGVAASIK